MSRCIAFALTLVSLAACMDDKGPEEDELAADGKDDSFRKPTYHGIVEFGGPVTSAITDDEKYHAWVFELSDPAEVDLTTSYAVLGQRRTDTVLYLYRWTGDSWGPYIARNDDYGTTTYSKLVRALEPGRYRAIVKGYAASTRGKFKLTVGCDGPGCDKGCLFGSTYHELKTAPALQLVGSNVITHPTLETLSASAQQMLVRAVQQSSHTDVTTPQEALSRVDQEEMNVSWYHEPAAQRTFLAFEYGAGDNSYGAVFEKRSEAMATSIQDGDLYNCEVQRETCVLPDYFFELASDPSFARVNGRTVASAGNLSAAETAQAERAFRYVYGEQLSVADGIARADGGTINVERYRHASGREVTAVQWYAGDTSVGAVFHASTTELAGVIDDSSIDGCSMFQWPTQ